MGTSQPAIRIDDLRMLVDQALLVADALGLEMVAAHLSMAKDALGKDESDD